MSVLRELIAPAAVGAAMTALLALALFFLLKRRDERKKRHFEVRYAEYRNCLRVLEEIAAAARIDLKQSYTAVVASTLKGVLAEPEQSSDYGLRLDRELDELGRQMRESFSKAASGLHGLGLACSGELLAMVDEFVKLQRELMEESISLIADARISNPSESVNEAMKEKAGRAESMFERILEQMRAELDLPAPARPGR